MGDAADILHRIPGGDLTGATGLTSNPINGTVYTGEGQWFTYNSANASVTVEGSGTNKCIELFSNWYVRSCSVWYRDDGITPTNAAWKISTVLTWTGGSGTINSLELFSGTDVSATPDFEVAFTGTSVSWRAGTETGAVTSATGLDSTRRTLSVSYDPVSGWATACLGEEALFSVNAGTGLYVKTVMLKHYEFTYNNGTLAVYNISSSLAEPEMVDTFEYATDTAAQSAWVEYDVGDPAEVEIEDGVPCVALYNDYTVSSLRGSWEKSVSLDLSAYDTISVGVKTTRTDSPSPVRVSLYLKSDGGWHSAFFSLTEKVWTKYLIPFTNFSPQLTTDELKDITDLKISCWQNGDSTPATVYVSGLQAGNWVNILSNSGFETTTSEDMPDWWGPAKAWGTSSQWVLDLDTWRSRWGVDRTVAHSGSNSLRIARSSASDQDMEAVSVWKNLNEEQTYTLSAWLRSNTSSLPVAFEVKGWSGSPSPTIVSTSSTTGTWERCSFTFTTPSDPDDIIYGVSCHIYSTNSGTLWIDDVQLEEGSMPTIWSSLIADPYIAADGMRKVVPVTADCTIMAGGTNLPVVSIDSTNRIFMVDNEPFIPRAIMWDGPPSTNITEHLAESGFNTIILMLRTSSVMQDVKDFLDDANGNGLRVIVNFWNDMGTTLQSTWINALKDDYPAIIMWYVADEPYGDDDWTAASNKYNNAKSLDDRPVMVNLCRDYDVDWCSDVVVMDYYPIGSGVTISSGLEILGDAVATLEQTGIAAGKPAWNFQQNTGYGYFCYRELTEAEAECQVYQSLVHGSRSIMYFYQKPRLEEHWKELRVLNDEIRQLTPVLYSTETPASVSVSPTNNVHFISKRYDGMNHVIAVNESPNPETITLTMPGDDAFVMFENRLVQSTNGTFSDVFAGYQRHVYCGANLHLKFDESSGTSASDGSGNSNDGTLSNMDNNDWVTGNIGNAIDFDGVNDYVDCGTDDSLELTGDLTLAFWINPDDVSGGRQNPLYKDHRGEFALTMETSGQLSYYHYRSNSPGYWGVYKDLLPSGTIVNGQWQHIAVTRDASTRTLKVYYNGDLEYTTTYPADAIPIVSTNSLLVAKGYTTALDGKMDDVRIYSRALTQSEIEVLVDL